MPWPTQGHADHGQPAQAGPAYHFPPPEPEPNYGYNQPVYAPQWGQQGDQRGYDLANYLPSDGPPAFQQTAHHQQAYAEPDPDYGDEFYEDEEPRRSRRWILIAAALIGAIGVGGALAYTYRSLIAPNHGRVPLVKADPNINKVKPDARGGKAFPGSDRKLPNRLGDGTVTAAVPPAEAEAKNGSGADENLGPRKIKTIPVGPQPGPATSPVSSVPGITLENMGPPAKTPAKTEEAAAPPEAADPPAAAAPPKADKADDDPPARPPPPTRHVVAKAAAGPPPTVRPPPLRTPSSGLGYVAVVSSQKTHMDALKAYADAAEKHPEVLSGKIPDVQEANLGEKGIWYRAVVGPPGSRDAAVHLCSQLKAVGHGCWVKEY